MPKDPSKNPHGKNTSKVSLPIEQADLLRAEPWGKPAEASGTLKPSDLGKKKR